MENKKAQGMSVTTIILIVLGLIVLVILILGFSLGWANLKEYIAPSSNVDSIVQQCSIACSTNQKYAFCTEKRDLKSKEGNLLEVTCNGLSLKESVYGVSECGAVQCEAFATEDEAITACTVDNPPVSVSYVAENATNVLYGCAMD